VTTRRGGAVGIRRDPRGGGIPGNTFSPLQVSSLWAWYRADLVTQSGNAISQWDDKSGNARHMTQGTANLKPTWDPLSSSFSGLDCVRFICDGVTNFDFLSMPDMSALTASEVWMIAKLVADPPSTQPKGGLWKIGNPAAGSCLYPNQGDSNIYDSYGSTTRKNTGDPTPSLASMHSYSVITTSSEWTNTVNGTQLFTTATNTTSFQASPVFGGNGVDTGMDGRVGEILIFSAKLSTADRTALKAYLSVRYGITIN